MKFKIKRLRIAIDLLVMGSIMLVLFVAAYSTNCKLYYFRVSTE